LEGPEIEFSREAARQYRRLPQDYKRLIDIALSGLVEGSGLDLRPVAGRADVYRIRVGRYRVLFTKLELAVLIIRISTRGDAYK